MRLPARVCAECGRTSVHAAVCRFCGAEGGRAVTLGGKGRLLSWTVIRVPPARYASEAPYAVGLIELTEGPRLTARLEGDPDRLARGQSMNLVAIDAARGPVFSLTPPES